MAIPDGGRLDVPDRIRRILVALDGSADSLAALDAAAALAALLEAELEGLFVEELDLLRLSSLPAVEIDLLSGEERRLDAGELERLLRSRAARARRALERAAEPLAVRWTFRTVRGRVQAEILAARADLVTLGARGHSPRRPPGSTVAAVLAGGTLPVLVLRRGARLGRTVHVLYDAAPGTEPALATAAELARRSGSVLSVLAAGEARPRLEEIEALLGRHPGEPGEAPGTAVGAPVRPGVRVEAVPGADPEALVELLRRRGCGLLVVPRRGTVLSAKALGEVVRRAHCPVMVVG